MVNIYELFYLWTVSEPRFVAVAGFKNIGYALLVHITVAVKRGNKKYANARDIVVFRRR